MPIASADETPLPDNQVAPRPRNSVAMKTFHLFMTAAFTFALSGFAQSAVAADHSGKSQAPDAAFVKKAAIGGMTEVELGRIAAEKGQSPAAKEFGSRMVTDHSKANDELKNIATKIGAAVPDKVDAKHQATIARFSKMSAGAAFDKAYAKDMVEDHQEDVAEFQKAEKQVKNSDLKKFITDTLPTLQEHLEMAKKM
jgi:putative membrane protein